MLGLSKLIRTSILQKYAFKFSSNNKYDVVVIGGGHAGC